MPTYSPIRMFASSRQGADYMPTRITYARFNVFPSRRSFAIGEGSKDGVQDWLKGLPRMRFFGLSKGFLSIVGVNYGQDP